MKVKVIRKVKSNNDIVINKSKRQYRPKNKLESDTIHKITLYSKNDEDLKCATELIRGNIHYKLRDIRNNDYIESRTVFSDSLHYDDIYSNRPDNSEVVEVVRNSDAKTTEAEMLEVIMTSILQSRYTYPNVVIDWKIYQKGNETSGTNHKEDKITLNVDPIIPFVNAERRLTDSDNLAYKDIIKLICLSRYGTLNDKKLDEFRKRITGVISDAYAKGLNAIAIPCGYIKVVPNLENTKYSERKISILAYYVMVLIFASGGDYDTDVEAVFVQPHMFIEHGISSISKSVFSLYSQDDTK